MPDGWLDTSKIYRDSEGGAFAHVVLDARAGIEQRRGNYVTAPADASVPLMPEETFLAISQSGHRAMQLMRAGGTEELRRAMLLLEEALTGLPDPSARWNANGWLLAHLAEVYFRTGRLTAARRALTDAMYCPGTIGNPWLHLRQGQVNYELSDMERADDELARAYLGGGREIFAKEDPKYMARVEAILRPPPGMERLP